MLEKATRWRKEAMFYERLPEGRVRCHLCRHHCVISQGRRGICGVRENRGHTLYTCVYGRAVAQHIDPVEKKPLFHFYPGSRVYSVGTPGCNFHCRWCQNWQISQVSGELTDRFASEEVTPEQIVAAARRGDCRSVAYTYTEPAIFFEYAYETARLAHEAGLANIFVTNGYLGEEALEWIHPWLDAANVDLKAFRDATYRKYVGAKLQPVLDGMKQLKRHGIWLEVTTLLIPGVNDDREQLHEMANFIAQELGIDTPWHLSRFSPAYRMVQTPPTPISSLHLARQIGCDAGLRYVYLGNVREEADTVCHDCGEVLVRRTILGVAENRVGAASRCPNCGTPVAGVGMEFTSLPPRQRGGRPLDA